MGGPLCTHRVAPDSAVPIDISPFLRSVSASAETGGGKGAEDPSLRLLYAQVREAAEGAGFFSVVGHGVPDQVHPRAILLLWAAPCATPSACSKSPFRAARILTPTTANRCGMQRHLLRTSSSPLRSNRSSRSCLATSEPCSVRGVALLTARLLGWLVDGWQGWVWCAPSCSLLISRNVLIKWFL